jgi:hypothetical protein
MPIPVPVWSAWVFLVFSGFCNGTFGVLLKLCKKYNPKMPLFVMLIYFGFGQVVLYICSLTINCLYLVDHFAPEAQCFTYTGWGIISAICNAIGVYATFVALFNLGVAVTPSVYAPTVIFTAMVTETCFSQVGGNGTNKEVKNAPLLLASITCITAGAAIVAVAKYAVNFANFIKRKDMTDNFVETSQVSCGLNDRPIELAVADEAVNDEERPNLALGLFSAVVGVGIFGGSVPYWLSPTYVPSHEFVPAFGTALSTAIGTIFVFPVVAFLHLAYLHTCNCLPARKDWGLASAFPLGTMSGILFAIGPLGIEYAVAVQASDPDNISAQGPALYAVPIWQTGILVSGLWGILLFKEMDTIASVLLFTFGSAILLLGIFLSGHAIS